MAKLLRAVDNRSVKQAANVIHKLADQLAASKFSDSQWEMVEGYAAMYRAWQASLDAQRAKQKPMKIQVSWKEPKPRKKRK